MEERRGFKELLNHLGFQKEGGGGVTADSARTAKKTAQTHARIHVGDNVKSAVWLSVLLWSDCTL